MYTTTEIPAGTEPVSFEQFQENISKQMNIPIGSFELRYRDDEGDVIAISSDMELQEAVRQAATRNPAVIEVIVETRQKEEKTEEVERPLVVIPEKQEETQSHPEATSEIILHNAVCSNCQFPIVGIRYKCAVCPNFDLCEICEMVDNSHPVEHPLIKAKRPLSPEFNHIFNLSTGIHNVERRIHNVSDGFQHGLHSFGNNVHQYGSQFGQQLNHFGTNVHQYGSQVGQQIKQSWTAHQPQIDAARQRAYDQWQHLNTEVKAQMKVISESMKVKAKEVAEALKKESEQWFSESQYPGTTSATTPAATPDATPAAAPTSVPAPVPAPAPTSTSTPTPVTAPVPVVASATLSSSPQRQSQPLPTHIHPSAPTPASQPNFQEQMATLSVMGFTDESRNVTLLTRYNGDVSLCVQDLLENTA